MPHLPNLPPGTAKNNFAQATARDSIVHGSFRPGFSEDTEKPGAVDDSAVAEWSKDLKESGIKRVVCLLKDEEVAYYRTPLEEQMKSAGFEWVRTPIDAPGAADVILNALHAADEAGEKVVVHCSGGAARTALGLGLWLVSKHGLSPEEAAKEIAENAEEAKVVRSPDVEKLTNLVRSSSRLVKPNV